MVKQQETETQTSDSRPKEAISVVIATHNQADALRRNLPRILEQEYERFEVIVVNDASTERHGKTVLKNPGTEIRQPASYLHPVRCTPYQP